MACLHVVMGSARSEDLRTGQNARESVKSKEGGWRGDWGDEYWKC
jgi:hypothetical protein